MPKTTRAQALALASTNWWEHATDREIAEFQLNEPLLCMPFDRFHEAVEKALGRPVFTHEFAFGGLLEELNGERPPRTFEDVLALLPAEKLLIVRTARDAEPEDPNV